MDTPHELPDWAAGHGSWAYGARLAHGTPADFCEEGPAAHDEFTAYRESLPDAWQA
jgi:hypothetical protein